MTSITKAFVVIAAVVAIVLPCTVRADGPPSGYEGYRLVRIDVANEQELDVLEELRALGHDFQVWSHAIRVGEIEVRVAPDAWPRLEASGLTYEVTVADLQKHIDEMFTAPAGPAAPGVDPFFDAIRTYNEHVQFLNDLAASYPDLTEVIEVGQSVEGRSMWALRITGEGDVKPGVLFHGAQHGNEQAAASVMAFVAHHLLTQYGSDPDITTLVDDVDWYIMPIMNPDGYVRFGRWNSNNVDLNRNWGGPGSGEDPWGGPFPFSEPETAAIRDFFLAHPTVRVHVDLHGYVPWLMWSWGWQEQHCPDHDRYMEIGTVMRDRIRDAGGGTYEIGSIWDVAYPVSGSGTDYAYGELALWALGLEVVHAQMPDICEEFYEALLYLGEWIRETDCQGNGLDDVCDLDCDAPGCDVSGCGQSSDCNTNGVPDACDIGRGDSADDNENGVPDECECAADIDGDEAVGLGDLLLLLSAWGPCPDCPEDLNGDDSVNLQDLLILLTSWGPCEV